MGTVTVLPKRHVFVRGMSLRRESTDLTTGITHSQEITVEYEVVLLVWQTELEPPYRPPFWKFWEKKLPAVNRFMVRSSNCDSIADSLFEAEFECLARTFPPAQRMTAKSGFVMN